LSSKPENTPLTKLRKLLKSFWRSIATKVNLKTSPADRRMLEKTRSRKRQKTSSFDKDILTGLFLI
jgi:hypothetical protein